MATRPVIEQYRNLRFHAAADTVLLARMRGIDYKIARITFGRDGSIYVQFPYCVEKAGWIGVLPIPAGHVGPVTYSLSEHGAFVETDVKFSHHTSGIALFSKTGQDIPSTRRHSFPLTGPIGHLFNLQVFEPAKFVRLERTDRKVKYLALDFPEDDRGSISWRAEWRRKEAVVANIRPPSGVAGPATTVQHRSSGVEEEMIFLGQPAGYGARDHVMMLTGGPSQSPTGVTGSGMAFLGGWNVHETATRGEPVNLGGCLAFMYPAREPKAGEMTEARNVSEANSPTDQPSPAG